MAFSEPSRLRVCVVGAGIIGLMIALRLQRAGARVTLVEADGADATRRASGAAAGMLGAVAEAMHAPDHAHPHLSAFGAMATEAWASFFEESPAFRDFHLKSGTVLAAFEESDLAGLQRAHQRAREYGVSHTWRDGAPKHWDAARFAPVRASLVLQDEGRIDAVPMLMALEAACRANGVLVRRKTRVLGVERAGAQFRVRFGDNELVEFDETVIASGALDRGACDGFAPSLARLIPAKGMLGLCASMGGAPLWPFVLRSPRFYAVAVNNSDVCFGATSQPGRDDLLPDLDAIAPLHAHLRNAAPGFQLDDARVFSVGVRPLSPDHAPIIGRDGADGPLVAIGHGRNGWLLAPLTARMIEAHVFQHTTAPLWSAFQPNRFDT